MAEISYTEEQGIGAGNHFIWPDASTGDTFQALQPGFAKPVAAAIQMTGTWNSTTAKLQCSNDGATWFDMTDVQGTAVSATADAIFEISSAALLLRPAISGGTSDEITFDLVMRA